MVLHILLHTPVSYMICNMKRHKGLDIDLEIKAIPAVAK